VIVVKVELLSAVTGDTTLLNSVVIDNQGGTVKRRNYRCRSYRKHLQPVQAVTERRKALREGQVLDHPSEQVSVLTLLRKSLEAMGY
jgi:hypothetical protein